MRGHQFKKCLVLKKIDDYTLNIIPFLKMYNDSYPVVDQLVMVKVMKINEYGAECSLLEYEGVDGRLDVSQCSKRRVKSIKNVVRLGKTEVMRVICVDSSKGYIDLTRKYITPDEIADTTRSYRNNKMAGSILNALSIKKNIQMDDLYDLVAKPIMENFDSLHDGMYQIFKDAENLNIIKVDDTLKDDFVTILQHKFRPKQVKVEALISVTCFGIDGIDAIKATLLKGMEYSTNEIPLTITNIACPIYSISTLTFYPNKTIQYLETVIQAMTERITSFDHGLIEIKQKPTII